MPALAHSLRIIFAIIVLAGAASVGAGRASATPPGTPGLIAIGCEAGLWTVEPDGENLVQVSDAEVLTPDWSPGGTMFAFTRSDGPGRASLWVMDADGSDERRRTYTMGEARDPSWWADASRVGYSTDQETALRQIRVIGPGPGGDFSGAHVYPDASVHDPAFSPDGFHALVVAAPDGGPQGIWLNGGEAYSIWQTNPPPDGSSDASPDWAPSADRYAFVRDDGTTRSIYAVDMDGSDIARLTDETVDTMSPTYAADGTRIAFLSRPVAEAGTDAPFDLWTMDADGGNKSLVTSDVACDHIDWQPVPDFPLVDARFSSFEPAIRWAFFEGITTGCAPERFCHQSLVTRGQMATFMAEAADLPAATEDHFGDDDGTTHEDDINRLAEAGLASGCGGDAFCPHQRLSRAEMASFLARALELPAALEDHFDDDDGMTHEANINRLAEAGLTSGCAPSRFCPTRPITRGETIAFLYRGFAP